MLLNVDELFLSFGGHKQACGFTLDKSALSDFKKFVVSQRINKDIDEENGNEIKIIDELPLELITETVKRELMKFAPFGFDNPPPFFLATNVSLSNGIYRYKTKSTNQERRIELNTDAQSWVGIDGKPISLDIVYYINSRGIPTVVDSRPSLFNKTM